MPQYASNSLASRAIAWTLGVVSGENTSTSTPANVVRAAAHQQPITSSSPTPLLTSTRVLRIGAAGRDVEDLHMLLSSRGFAVSMPYTVYTASTAAAVKQFQQSQGLTADGIVGPRTKAALLTSGKPGDIASPAPVAPPYSPAAPQWQQFASPGQTPPSPQDQPVGPPAKNPLRPVAIGLLAASGVILVGSVLLRR